MCAQNSRNAPTVYPPVSEEACSLVRMQWSPEQIAARLPNSHEAFTSMFMRTRVGAEFFGRVCAARSKRESAIRTEEIGGRRSPKENHLVRENRAMSTVSNQETRMIQKRKKRPRTHRLVWVDSPENQNYESTPG